MRNESVGPVGPVEVAAPQIPDAATGWKRAGIEYRHSTDGTRVDFVATDKRA